MNPNDLSAAIGLAILCYAMGMLTVWLLGTRVRYITADYRLWKELNLDGHEVHLVSPHEFVEQLEAIQRERLREFTAGGDGA
jgi:hypothetical protein